MDIERTMQFIVEQQARHEAAVQKFDEQMAKHDDRIAKNEQMNSGLRPSPIWSAGWRKLEFV
jgi:hypothetical protein